MPLSNPTAFAHPLHRRSVYVRVRPLNDAERERGAAWRVEGNGVYQVRQCQGALPCQADQIQAICTVPKPMRTHIPARSPSARLPTARMRGHRPSFPHFLPSPRRQVDPASEARVSDNAYKLDAIFDGSQPTAAVYEATTQGLIRQVGAAIVLHGAACVPRLVPDEQAQARKAC